MPKRKRKNSLGVQVQQTTEPKKTRKIKILSLQDKISVIHHYNHVTNTRKLGKIYGVCRGQIRSILWKKEKYLAEWKGKVDANKANLKHMVRSAILGALVHEWVQRARNQGKKVRDTEIRQTARQAAHLINFKEYRPSPGWLNRFKIKYKIQNLNPSNEIQGPKKSTNISKIFLDLKSERVEVMLDKRFKRPPTAVLEELEKVALEMKQVKKQKNEEGYGASSTESATEDEEFEIDIGAVKGLPEKGIAKEDILEPIKSYREALDQLELLENFALTKEDFRVVGLINQLENLFLEEIS